MTYILSLDPGKNTGAALGFYDAITPYRLISRFQIHGGSEGFTRWWRTERPESDEIVCESFSLREENDFAADLTPVRIEGVLDSVLIPDLREETGWGGLFLYQQPSDKGSMIGYPQWCKTKVQRKRFRYDFLDRFGLFKAGTEFDDSNDAITHALVYLRRRKHYPSMTAFWPQPIKPPRMIRGESSSSASPGF